MAEIPKLGENHIQAICDIIGDTSQGLTGSDIGRLLSQCVIQDRNPAMTKRHRLFLALRTKQESDACANNVLNFVQTVMNPVRFVGNSAGFEALRGRLNEVLLFSGLSIGEDGKVRRVTAATTLPEAQVKAGRLLAALQRRGVHQDVFRFCRAELLRDNYFHAVFKATKSVAQKIRDKTGLTGDGADIVDQAFGINAPMLAINTLRTETEQSEQKGFVNLLKGMFGTIRNPTGHAPKIAWKIEKQDALDLLSLVSYLHRRLDFAVSVPGSQRDPNPP